MASYWIWIHSIFNSSYFWCSNASFASSLTYGLFLIIFARDAYFKVCNPSAKLQKAGLIFAIIRVLLFPPNESASNLVNFEFLYGTWEAPFTNKFITFPSVVKDKLMLIPSFNPSSEVFVCFYFSDPAKSTRFNLPILKEESLVILSVSLLSTKIDKIECDLEE